MVGKVEVFIDEQSDDSNNRAKRVIELAAERTIRFGSMLAAERVEWRKAALRELPLRGDRKPNQFRLPDVDGIAREGK